MSPEKLAFENEMALYLQQALLGCITPAFRAIAFEADEHSRTVDLYLALTESVDEIDEILYDIEASMDGFTGGSVLIRPQEWIGDDWTEHWPGRDLRRLFVMRTSWPEHRED